MSHNMNYIGPMFPIGMSAQACIPTQGRDDWRKYKVTNGGQLLVAQYILHRSTPGYGCDVKHLAKYSTVQ